eukprot:CFRG7693T1
MKVPPERAGRQPLSPAVDFEGGSLLDGLYVLQREGRATTRLMCVVGVIMFAVLVRYCVGLGPYSGYASPPMFGDFECQRHWMELTFHLPPEQWYIASADNNLTYWGLDYPPLSGYWSYCWGALANTIDPSWVALHTSHGMETAASKNFMRFTVIASDLLLWIPVCITFAYIHHKSSAWANKTLLILSMVMSPALILVDHGHFQYNGVSLSLALAGAVLVSCMDMREYANAGMDMGVEWPELAGSMCFVGSFMYKQMSLYYALPFFAFLLGKCIRHSSTWRIAVMRIVRIGFAVVLAICMCVLPVASDIYSVLGVVNRIFPVGRGLYEDKVANVWCSISPIIKLKEKYSTQILTRLCAIATLILAVPKCFHLGRHPTPLNFLVTLLNCSLAFFLVSYHVHEKSILLCVMPAAALLLHYPLVSVVINYYAAFSIYPLLKREGLGLYLLAIVMLYGLTIQPLVWSHIDSLGQWSKAATYMVYLSAFGSVVLIACDLSVTPPARLPDIWTLLITSYSCAHFIFIYVLTLAPSLPSPLHDDNLSVGMKKRK